MNTLAPNQHSSYFALVPSASSNPIRILITDDHSIITDSLSSMFQSIPDFEVVGTAHEGKQALHLLEVNEIDVLLTDLTMPVMNGIELALQTRERFPKVRVILLTMVEEASKIKDAIRVGIAGYVLKTEGREILEQAIRQVMTGKRFFSEVAVMELAQYEEHLSEDEALASLTNREIEILKLVCHECTNQEIADKLFISIPTVESHRRNLMQKIGCKTAIGLAKFGVKHGLV